MKNNYFCLIFIFLLVITSPSFGGCGWIATLDTSYCKDTEGFANRREKLKSLALKYRGGSSYQVQNDLGRPSRIIKEGKILILNDEECIKNWQGVLHWGDCESGKADEVWEYNYKERDKCGWVFYGSRFYILGSEVVDIR